jgi:hypothetical protein
MAFEVETSLSPQHQNALRRAVLLLENPDFAARLAEYAGQPFHRVLRMMPKAANDRLNRIVETAILNCLNVAINSLQPSSRCPPASRASSVLAGISGGVSGFFGLAALPLELPVTTTLMLRSIADIARHHGEDLSELEARLACIAVLGLGANRSGKRLDLGYYASRALLTRLVNDASALLLERGVAGASAPVVAGFIAEIVPRFSIVVSERATAGALPVLGALGGASVNFLFMTHFQRIAHGHFTVRRLERHYGADAVRRYYDALAAQRPTAPRRPLLLRAATKTRRIP